MKKAIRIINLIYVGIYSIAWIAFLILFIVCHTNQNILIEEGLLSPKDAQEVINLYLFLFILTLLLSISCLLVSILIRKILWKVGKKEELIPYAILCLFFASPISAILMLVMPKKELQAL